MVELAAILFSILTSITALFQFALAAGAPWGHLTWGGKFDGTLPGRMRAAAIFSALLLVSFGIIVIARAGLLEADWTPLSRTLIWVVVVYCGIGVFANAATRSKWERRIWLPVVLGMLGTSLLVATAG